MGRIGLALGAALLAAGCAGSPLRLSMMDEQDLQSVSSRDLAHAYHAFGSDKFRAELQRRELFSPAEWSAIDAHSIFIGMQFLALYASWGFPSDVNSTVGSWGTSSQLVYGPSRYVYLEDGVVTAWQQ